MNRLGFELAIELMILAGCGAALLVVGRLLNDGRKDFAVGVLAASISAVVVLTLSYLTIDAVRSSLLVAPIVEEAAKAICVFVVLARPSFNTNNALAFALGYALLEPTYKVSSLASQLMMGAEIEGAVLPFVVDTSFYFVVPFSALLALALFMCALRAYGVAGPLATIICVVAHATYNLWDVVEGNTETWGVAFGSVITRLAICLPLGLLLMFLLRRKEHATPA